MNARQQALAGYILTIREHVRGARNTEELITKVILCIREDAKFLGTGFAAGAEALFKKYAENKAASGADVVSSLIRNLFENLGSRNRKR